MRGGGGRKEEGGRGEGGRGEGGRKEGKREEEEREGEMEEKEKEKREGGRRNEGKDGRRMVLDILFSSNTKTLQYVCIAHYEFQFLSTSLNEQRSITGHVLL